MTNCCTSYPSLFDTKWKRHPREASFQTSHVADVWFRQTAVDLIAHRYRFQKCVRPSELMHAMEQEMCFHVFFLFQNDFLSFISDQPTKQTLMRLSCILSLVANTRRRYFFLNFVN